jgi:predicted nucleic acid-binding protein
MPELSPPPRNTAFIVLLGLASAASYWSCATFTRIPRPGSQYLSILLFLVLSVVICVCVGRALSRFRQHRRSSAALGGAALLSIAGLFAAQHAGVWLHDRDFQRLRPTMERIVHEFQASPDSSMRLDSVAVPVALRPPIYSVWASRDRTRRVDVWFFYGFGFPPNHSAWVFTSDSAASPASIRGWFWHRSRQLTPHWHNASD